MLMLALAVGSDTKHSDTVADAAHNRNLIFEKEYGRGCRNNSLTISCHLHNADQLHTLLPTQELEGFFNRLTKKVTCEALSKPNDEHNHATFARSSIATNDSCVKVDAQPFTQQLATALFFSWLAGPRRRRGYGQVPSFH
jgi:hypothetical protein